MKDAVEWLHPALRAKDQWSRTKNLLLVMLGPWILYFVVIHVFITALNKVSVLGFPLGFYLAVQGSLIAFAVMLFWFGRQQRS
jgi:putative solute:sodium symporter small subunit